MVLNAYTLYDVKTESYSAPFFAVSHGAAVRMLTDVASDLATTVGRYPADYTLFCVGSFDDQRGLVLPIDNRQHITDALTCARTKTNEVKNG